MLKHSQKQSEDNNGLKDLSFTNTTDAKQFCDSLRDILPILNEEYPLVQENRVLLTEDQFHFHCIHEMYQSGNLKPEFIAGNYYLKTLRADELDFSSIFINGIIPGENGKRRHNLRPAPRKKYSITPQGTVESRLHKKPMYPADLKEKYSQHQSTTLIDPDLKAEPFGINKSRIGSLYGILTHKNDTLVNRFIVQDGGTVAHIYDTEKPEDLENTRFYNQRVKKPNFYPPEKENEFIEHFVNSQYQMNEVLARIRFNPYRTLICICSDSLESQLLASQFSEELLVEFSRYAQKNNLHLNPNYRIPIVFYNKRALDGRRNLTFYTDKMQSEDRTLCKKLITRETIFEFKDFELLLGLDDISPDILLAPVSSGSYVAMHLLKTNRVALLIKLFNIAGSSVTKIVIDHLLKSNDISQNSSLISEFISVEAFKIARNLIDKTQSDIQQLHFRGNNLEHHLAQYGNPRQIDFVGLDRILLSAAKAGHWCTVKHCVKEYPNLDKKILGELLFFSTSQQNHVMAQFLLRSGADISVQIVGKTSLEEAAQLQDWEMICIFINFSTTHSSLEYGLEFLLKHQDNDITRKVFDILLSIAYIDLGKNDLFTSEFIVTFGFNLPEKTILQDINLCDIILDKDTLSPVQLVGLSILLTVKATRKFWKDIETFLEKYPDIDKRILGKLLHIACQQENHNQALKLLKRKADRSVIVDGASALSISVERKDWVMVSIFCDFIAPPTDLIIYGKAVPEAIKLMQFSLVKLLIDVGAQPPENVNVFEAPLTIALNLNFNLVDLISDLIRFERRNTSSQQFQHILMLSYDLACVKNFEESAAIIQESIEIPIQTENSEEIQKLILYGFIDTLCYNFELAKRGIQNNFGRYKLQSCAPGNIKSDLDFLMPHFPIVIKKFSNNKLNFIFERVLAFLISENLLLTYITYLFSEGFTLSDLNALYEKVVYMLADQDQETLASFGKFIANDIERIPHWQKVIDVGLHLSIKNREFEKALLFLHLGANLRYHCDNNCCPKNGKTTLSLGNIWSGSLPEHQCENNCLEKQKTNFGQFYYDNLGSEKLACEILDNHNLTPEELDYALFIAVDQYANTRFQLLIYHGAVVTIEHLKVGFRIGSGLACRQRIEFIIQHIDKKKYQDPKYYPDFFHIISFIGEEYLERNKHNYIDADFVLSHISLLAHFINRHIIKHLILISIVSIFQTHRGSSSSGDVPVLKLYENLNSLSSYLLSTKITDFRHYTDSCQPISDFDRALTVLNNYFSNPDTVFTQIPDQTTIDRTFDQILELMEQAFNPVSYQINRFRFHHFKNYHRKDDFSYLVIKYLKSASSILSTTPDLSINSEALPSKLYFN